MSRRTPGSYILLLRLDQERLIAVGRRGVSAFPGGWYAYAGSALGGLWERVGRHVRGEGRSFWHIDYLAQHASLEAVVTVESEERLECRLASGLAARLPVVPGFGSSDCRCHSHLAHCGDREMLLGASMDTVVFLGYSPQWTPVERVRARPRHS